MNCQLGIHRDFVPFVRDTDNPVQWFSAFSNETLLDRAFGTGETCITRSPVDAVVKIGLSVDVSEGAKGRRLDEIGWVGERRWEVGSQIVIAGTKRIEFGDTQTVTKRLDAFGEPRAVDLVLVADRVGVEEPELVW